MKRILIVEDDNEIAELQRDYLEINGYQVVVESDGKKGLKNAKSNNYDLVVLDVMLPSLDGFSICKELRREKQVPVMFLSARVDDIDKIRGLGLGADDYMVKPFSPSEFVARVGAHIERYNILTEGRPSHDEIIIRNLKIDFSSHKVFLNNEEIAMPHKEFELLAYLMRNPDKVIGKEKLLNEVWGVDAYVEVATVAVHINRLREKIEEDPSNPKFIDTVWGVGYRFVL